MVPQRWSRFVADKEIAVKKYVVKLADDEREQLNTLIRSGKHAARKLLKARILLKADVSDAGEGWSDSQIAAALDTSVDTVARTRQRLVEEGLEAALVYKYSPASARPRIFDGAAEAKLIALACSKPPAGRARWTLQLLEEKVVELSIVERASDNTIGRTLKKTISSPTCRSNGLSRRTATPHS
jgi:transposase